MKLRVIRIGFGAMLQLLGCGDCLDHAASRSFILPGIFRSTRHACGCIACIFLQFVVFDFHPCRPDAELEKDVEHVNMKELNCTSRISQTSIPMETGAFCL